MLLTPGLRVARGDAEERIARLTRTAISVATPHRGTPLANHFLSVQGHTLLLVLSALATSGQGRGAILAAAKAIALVARLDDWLGRRETPLDRIAASLLRKIRFDRKDPVWKYLGEIEHDQGAVLQLTPEGIDLFDAAVADHADIAYSCVVAGVPKPRETFASGRWWTPSTSRCGRCSGSCTRSRRGRTRTIRIPSRAGRRSGCSIAASASRRRRASATASCRR